MDISETWTFQRQDIGHFRDMDISDMDISEKWTFQFHRQDIF